MKKLLFFVCAIFAFVACTQIVIEEQQGIAIEASETLTVGFEDGDQTRIQLNEAQKTVWNKEDLASVFYRSDANQKWQYQGETGERVGDLKRVENAVGTTKTTKTVVVYPYSENYWLNTDSYAIEATLPATQYYTAGSYGVGSNLMVSQSEFTQFSLKSVCGWLKLQLTGNGEVVKSIKFRGNNEEQVAGLIYVDTATAEATLASEMGGSDDNNAGGNLVFDDTIFTELTLDCGEGVTLGEEVTTFYLSLPPQTFANGFTVDIESEGYEILTLSTTNELVIERNMIQPMTAVEAEFVPMEVKPANNEIYYTNGSTTEATTPYKTDVFGVNIVSNTYDAEKECWVIKFDGEVTTIGSYAFNRCSTITSVTIPESVTSINTGAFANCSGLKSFTIPNSVTSIGTEAFYNTGITSITIPESVNSIGYRVFQDSSYIEKFEGKFATNDGCCLIVDGRLISFAVACDVTEYTIPDTVTSIGGSAFEGCANLISVNIPESVNSIEESAFSGCQNLKSVVIPKGIYSVGYHVFSHCISLTEIYCKNPALTINSDLFDYHANDFKIYVPSSSVIRYRTTENWVKYVDYIVGYNFNTGEIVNIPTKPADNEIWYLGSIPSISGLSIEFNADLGCMVMTCPGLLNYIPQRMFYNMDFLEAVILPDCVTSIENEAFAGCTSLMSIVIPDSVTTLGSGVFSGCTKLSSVTFGKNLTEIPSSAFLNCTSLPGSIAIPEGITHIRNGAFASSGLKSVTLPSSLTHIASGAFAGIIFVDCSAIATPPQIESDAFVGNSNLIILVPAASLNAYKSAWGMYAPYIIC